MFKKIFIIIVLTFYLLASCSVAFPLIEYVLHYKYISTVLCVNKSKPELKCCGKCYVKKKIVNAEESDNPAKPIAPKERQLPELTLYSLASIYEVDLIPKFSVHFHISRIIPGLLWGYYSLPSQPPEA